MHDLALHNVSLARRAAFDASSEPASSEPVSSEPVSSELAAHESTVFNDAACDDAVRDAREHELDMRSRSTKRSLRITARPSRRYGTWRVYSKVSGRTYEVVWPDEALLSCSCADARTSELLLCKHSAYVKAKAPKRGVPLGRSLVMLRPQPSDGRVGARLKDVQVYVPKDRAPHIRSLLDSHGRPLHSVKASVLQEALGRTRDLQWAEGARAFLAMLVSDDEWTWRFLRFEKKVRRHLEHGNKAPAPWARMQHALSCQLRPYQIEGVLFAARERRALLADDMGLGKTLQAIATIVLLREMGEPTRTLVVCPSSVKSQWKAEIGKFAPALRAEIIEGNRLTRRALVKRGNADIYILNFATLRNDLGELRALSPDFLVVDEAQRIKNWNTKTAKAVKSLRCPRVLALTGTPLENRLSELHSVMELLDPRALGPLWRLMPEHAVRCEDGRVEGVKRLGLLRERMGTRWLRRTRPDVLSELPERSDKTWQAEWSGAQQTAHARHHAVVREASEQKEAHPGRLPPAHGGDAEHAAHLQWPGALSLQRAGPDARRAQRCAAAQALPLSQARARARCAE